ncbi:MAG: hypothetical protein ACE5I3_02975 [Phycisphaerae bacterium]
MRAFSALAGAVLALAAMPSAADVRVVYDAEGFEGFPLGPINGNPGWYAYGYNYANPPGPPGVEPVVVDLPDGNRAVQLEVPDAYGAMSYMQMSWWPLVDTSSGQLRIEFDIFRESDDWTSNLWWMLYLDDWVGPVPYGIQWDTGTGISYTYPFGFDGPRRRTAHERFASLALVWDFDDLLATAEYDGWTLGPVAFDPFNPVETLAMHLAHDEATGTGPEVLWIDNLRITWIPEPASLLGMLVVATVGVLRPR